MNETCNITLKDEPTLVSDVVSRIAPIQHEGNQKRTLGKLIRKTLVELISDFQGLGGDIVFCETIKDEIRAMSANDVLDHLNSKQFNTNHFIIGKIPLIFLIESDAGSKYIQILALANENIETWFNRVSQPESHQNTSTENPTIGIESMLSMIDPTLDLGENSPLIALTKDLTKEFISDNNGSAPNFDFAQMMKKIQGKLESKIQSGEFDIQQLRSQADQVMGKMNSNPDFAGILNQSEMFAGMANLMSPSSKKTQK